MNHKLIRPKKFLSLFISAVILFTAVFSVYAFYQNNFLMTAYYEISDEKLTDDLDGFVIAQISDLHNTSSSYLQNSILAELKSILPDIIVITGDFIDCRRTDTEFALEYAKLLLDIAPVFMSAGNHEAAAYTEYPAFEKKLISCGVKVLRNSCVTFTEGNSTFNIIGIDDPVFSSEDNKFGHTKNVISSISYDKKLFTLALAHRPEVFSVYANAELSLVLSGHAHGGQIRLPFIGGLFTPSEGLFPKYSEGLFEDNGTKMIVSRGIGSSVFPFRINNRPELVIVTLKNG